jgi:hypothetical protein
VEDFVLGRLHRDLAQYHPHGELSAEGEVEVAGAASKNGV